MPLIWYLSTKISIQRNLIVGEDNRLWFVDWAWAGFYPEWWEWVAMKAQAENEEVLTKKADLFWTKHLITAVCGREYHDVDAW